LVQLHIHQNGLLMSALGKADVPSGRICKRPEVEANGLIRKTICDKRPGTSRLAWRIDEELSWQLWMLEEAEMIGDEHN
jgi:hypothetical protein